MTESISEPLQRVLRSANELCEQERIALRQRLAIRSRLDYVKRDILLHVDSQIELATRTRSCSKEPDLIAWIETQFRAGEVLFDIGANIGAYSLVASKFFDGNARIYAFEPSFVTFSQLCRNVQLNACTSSITPLQCALSDKTGIETLNYNNLNPGGALHALGACIDYKGEAFEPVLRQPVMSFRLDDAIAILKLPQPNHVKIDVDGIELLILRGGNRTLQNPALRTLVVELETGSRDEADAIALLSDAGLKLRQRHPTLPSVNTEPLARMHNYFFART